MKAREIYCVCTSRNGWISFCIITCLSFRHISKRIFGTKHDAKNSPHIKIHCLVVEKQVTRSVPERVQAVIEVEGCNFLPPKLPTKREKVEHEFMYITQLAAQEGVFSVQTLLFVCSRTSSFVLLHLVNTC